MSLSMAYCDYDWHPFMLYSLMYLTWGTSSNSWTTYQRRCFEPTMLPSHCRPSWTGSKWRTDHPFPRTARVARSWCQLFGQQTAPSLDRDEDRRRDGQAQNQDAWLLQFTRLFRNEEGESRHIEIIKHDRKMTCAHLWQLPQQPQRRYPEISGIKS